MWDWIPKLVELKNSRREFVIATVTNVVGSAPREMGAKMLILKGGEFFGTVGGGKLESLVLEEAKKCFETGASKLAKFPLCIRAGQCCGGAVEVFLELNGNGPLLYLYGAGHVGQALCKTLVGTPFTVHLVDDRAEWVHHPEVPHQTITHHENWKDFNARAEWNSDTVYVAVMTYLHDMDLEIIADVSKRNTKFIGLIGSQTKWARFTQRLKNMGLSDVELGRIHCPIGLPTGGKAPAEVAISVSAQLLQLHYKKSADVSVEAQE